MCNFKSMTWQMCNLSENSVNLYRNVLLVNRSVRQRIAVKWEMVFWENVILGKGDF